CNYALPKDHCKNRSDWRLLPGKSPERLSPHYQLNCEFGTALMITCRNDGGEPLYVCEQHAKELGYPTSVGENAASPCGQADELKESERSARTEPIAGLKKAASAPSKAENGAPNTHRRPTKPAQSHAQRCAAIDRQIGECATQLKNIL